MNKCLLLIAFGLLQACASSPERSASAPDSIPVAQPPVSAKQAFLASSGAASVSGLAGEKGLNVVPVTQAEAKHKSTAEAGAVAHYQGLTYWIDRSKRGGGFQRVTASTEFHKGDRIRFHLRSNRSGYLYMVTRGVSGRTSYLFPTKANASEFIQANQDYTIPSQDAIVFDDRSGTEEVWLFLSDKPLSDNDSNAAATQPATDSTQILAANTCGSKDLVLNSPDSAQEDCGPKKVGGRSKDILVEDDTQSTEPGGYSVMSSEHFDQGALLSLKLQLRHK